MKKVVLSSKADEIRKARDEWEAEYEQRKAKYQEEHQKYNKALDEVYAPVEDKIRSGLAKFNLIDFDINVSEAGWRMNGLEVRIRANDSNHFDDNISFSWSFEVALNENNEVEKKTSSWSGLKATTESQMAHLEQTVEALKFLNSIDWSKLLDQVLPDYESYHTASNSRYGRPNFEADLKAAELEEYVGTDTMLFGHTIPEYESRWNREIPSWFIILGETPKQYKIGDISVYNAKQMFEQGKSIEEIIEYAKKYPYRMRKDRLQGTLKYPYVEFNENTAVNLNRKGEIE